MKSLVFVETKNLTREEWLKYRRKGICGSDVSCLLGINKFKSELELWQEKTNQIPLETKDNKYMEWGRIIEPIIRNHFSNVTGKDVVEIKAILQHPENRFMLANVDGIVINDNEEPALLEIKTTSEYKRNDWSDGVPIYYQTQVQHYLMVTGLSKAYVAVLIGGNTFQIHEVYADAEVQAMLLAVEQEFWNKVQNMIRPNIDGSDAAKIYLDNLYTGGLKEELLLPTDAIEFVDEYLQACADEEVIKAKKQEATNHLKEYLKDHEQAICGNHKITWKSVTTERFDSKKFKEEHPDIYQQYVKQSCSRRFNVK